MTRDAATEQPGSSETRFIPVTVCLTCFNEVNAALVFWPNTRLRKNFYPQAFFTTNYKTELYTSPYLTSKIGHGTLQYTYIILHLHTSDFVYNCNICKVLITLVLAFYPHFSLIHFISKLYCLVSWLIRWHISLPNITVHGKRKFDCFCKS